MITNGIRLTAATSPMARSFHLHDVALQGAQPPMLRRVGSGDELVPGEDATGHHLLARQRRRQRQRHQLRIGGQEAVVGVGDLPEGDPQGSGVQIVLHAVAAHHHVAEVQPGPYAAGDAGDDEIVGPRPVNGVLGHHGGGRLADAGAHQQDIGGAELEPVAGERRGSRGRGQVVGAAKGIDLLPEGSENGDLHGSVARGKRDRSGKSRRPPQAASEASEVRWHP